MIYISQDVSNNTIDGLDRFKSKGAKWKTLVKSLSISFKKKSKFTMTTALMLKEQSSSALNSDIPAKALLMNSSESFEGKVVNGDFYKAAYEHMKRERDSALKLIVQLQSEFSMQIKLLEERIKTE